MGTQFQLGHNLSYLADKAIDFFYSNQNEQTLLAFSALLGLISSQHNNTALISVNQIDPKINNCRPNFVTLQVYKDHNRTTPEFGLMFVEPGFMLAGMNYANVKEPPEPTDDTTDVPFIDLASGKLVLYKSVGMDDKMLYAVTTHTNMTLTETVIKAIIRAQIIQQENE